MTQQSGPEPTAAVAAAPSPDLAASHRTPGGSDLGPIAVVGRGRLGSVLFRALVDAEIPVTGPHPRGYPDQRESESSVPDAIVLLCVPDTAIAAAARSIPAGPLVAHCSGASGLSEIAPHRGFSMHPVMTFTHETSPAVLRGIGAAVAGTDPAALEVARRLATTLGMLPFDVADADRIAYHAATAIAANFLVTLESAVAAW